jgi:hypothetical protein
MTRNRSEPSTATFDTVWSVGLSLGDVEKARKYDGSPVLKTAGSFMAGVATHSSAEPATLVVRVDADEREGLLTDAPDTYYLTDYYRRHPVVLVRLARIDRDVLRDLLSMSRQATLSRTPRRRRSPAWTRPARFR